MSAEIHHSAASDPSNVAHAVDGDAVRQALQNGPNGALLIAATALGLLLLGWLAFYFLLFLPRGAVN